MDDLNIDFHPRRREALSVRWRCTCGGIKMVSPVFFHRVCKTMILPNTHIYGNVYGRKLLTVWWYNVYCSVPSSKCYRYETLIQTCTGS